VELKALTQDDFYRILTEPQYNLIKQQQVRQDLHESVRFNVMLAMANTSAPPVPSACGTAVRHRAIQYLANSLVAEFIDDWTHKLITTATQMLLATEGVDLHFTDAAVREMARLAEEVNRSTENIGARRLASILERCVESVSFAAPELAKQVCGSDFVVEARLDVCVPW
jgi:ATP-dependent protease HslVU (ClpYQ) ATPase subunit